MLYIVKNVEADFRSLPEGVKALRAFPNRFFLYEAESDIGIQVPESVQTGIRFFDVPNGKKLRVNILGSDVAAAESGERLYIQYTQEQLDARVAFKRWLVRFVYVPEMERLGKPVNAEALSAIDNAVDDSNLDTIIQENFYYDL